MPIKPSGKPDKLDPRQLGGSFFFLFLLMLALNLLLPDLLSGKGVVQEVRYSAFLEQVEQGKVAEALIGPDQIRYTLKADLKADRPAGETSVSPDFYQKIYVTSPILDLTLPDILRKYQVSFTAPPPDPNTWFYTLVGWVAPPLIFFGIWYWFINRSQGPAALTVGKSKARIYGEGSTGVTFAQVAGVDEAKAELQEIVEFLKNAQKYTRLGAKIPKGVLLVGPPGTGKTLLAKAVAGEAGVPFFSISGSEFIELFVGVGAARVRDLFEQAKQKAPCIIFVDELDAIGKSRGGTMGFSGGNDEREQTLNQLLTEMDGFTTNSGVILLAATNRPEILDPALLRPGRFDRQVVVDRPDKIGREQILQVHAKQIKLSPETNLTSIAARTPGFSGADLANLVNEAALMAARRNAEFVTNQDFAEASERILAGLEKRSRVLNENEKKTVAYHEVGHALLGALVPGAGKVEKISIVPRGVAALGYTLQLPEEDRFLLGEDELRGRLAILLAGRSAEEVVFGKVSSGASDDIQKATDLAERAVTLYGMSRLGPIAYEKNQQQFLEGYVNPRRSVSPMLAESIDEEVKYFIDGAHQMARTVLEQNQPLLEELAQRLLEQEVLEGAVLCEPLSRVVAPKSLAPWLQTGTLSPEQ